MRISGGILKFAVSIVAVFFTAELLFLFSPVLINSFLKKEQIVGIFKNITGKSLDYENLSVKTYPDFSVKINSDGLKIENILNTDDLDIKVGITKLIFKRLSVKDFKANNLKIYIVRNPDNTTNIDELIKTLPFTPVIKNTDFNINGYKLFFADKFVNQNLQFEGEKLAGAINKNLIKIETKGNLKNENHSSDIDIAVELPNPDKKQGLKNSKKYFIITGYIKNLHPEIFEEYIKIPDKDIYDIQGVINAEFRPDFKNGKLKSEDINISVDGFKILSKIPEKSIIFSNKNTINSHLTFNNQTLIIDNFEFSGDKFKILADGKIQKWGTKFPKADLDININNAKAEELYWMLPSNLFTEELEILKIKKYGAYADVKGNLQIKGDILKPEVYGAVDFDNVWVLDGLPPEVPKATVKTQFKKDKVYTDVKVWATPKEYVTVTGWSDFFDLSKNEYQINSTDNVPLSVAEKILVPVSEVLGFIIGPVPIMDIKGYGNIDLYVSGSKEKPYLKGIFHYKDATASFNGINLQLEKAFGGVDFKKDKVYFYTDKGFIWGQPASIKGVSDSGVNVNYQAEVKNIPMDKLINTLKTSPMLGEQVKPANLIKSADGIADLSLTVAGKMEMKDVKRVMHGDVMEFLSPYGDLQIRNGSLITDNPPVNLSKINGLVKFNLNEIKPDLTANIYNSAVTIKGLLGEKSDLNVVSTGMKLKDSIRILTGMNVVNNDLKIKDVSESTAFKMNMNYKGNIKNIDYDKIKLSADFPNKSKSNAIIDVLSGNILLNNGDLSLKNIHSKFYNTTAKINGSVTDLFKKPVANGDFSVTKLDLKMINSIKNSDILPPKYRRILNAYKNYEGYISAKLNIRNNNLNGDIWLRDIAFIHSILEFPFSVKSADFNFKNGNLDIKSFNASFAGTPVFMNGKVKNIIKTPDMDINFTSKLSEDFVDNYINTILSYPIKVKGEILLSSRIKGTFNSLNIYPSVKIEEGGDISYMGANLGDENSIREFKGDFKYTKDRFSIKNFDYSKYIYSQNNKLYPLPLVNLKSEFKFIKNKIFIDNMDIKTFNPINANIFNAAFKKSLIKSGNMTCDINIKGYSDRPKITGVLKLKSLQIPSSELSVDNLNVYFDPKYINLKSNAKYLGSDVNILAKIRNDNFNIIHFDNLEIHSKKLNLDKLLYSLNEISYSRPIQILWGISSGEQFPIDTKKLLIDHGKWIVDEIVYKNLPVSNFSGKLSFKNSQLKLNEVLLDIAGGKLNGEFGYNFEKAMVHAKAEVDDVDANEMTQAFFDIKNQIFGKLDGQVDITTLGAKDLEQKKNLNGTLNFSINKGKMPKLGSIEYLLRAGNLIKSGISGLTINNIKSILIPVQTGEFETIKGNLSINNGVAKDIKIYSKGQNLSILIFGDYNIPTANADIYVLGKLSKNIDSILGPIGNASLNSFFNLIPGVHLDEAKDTDLIKQINSIPELGLSSNKFRIFRVKIDGDLNSDDFVNTFEWIDK